MKFTLAAFADEADASIDGQIAAMADNDISMLEIRGVDGQNIADISVQKAKEIRSKLSAHGIGVWSIGSPYGKIGIGDDFAAHLDSYKRGLETADILGAGHIRLFSFYVPDDEKEQYKNKVMEQLACFVEAAEGSGIVLCHENEKGIYGDNAAGCEEIHQHVPSLKAVFDPANFIQCGQDTLEAWDKLGPYVEYLHIKDALANGKVVPAGKGIGNIPYLLGKYEGRVLSLEPHLAVFEGLDALEGEHKTLVDEYSYPSSRAAFDASAQALKSLIG
jgi:sugar phosphate isomerase/epimerase